MGGKTEDCGGGAAGAGCHPPFSLSCSCCSHHVGMSAPSLRFRMQADQWNHLLRRVNLTSGLVTTLAGRNTSGRANGVGTAATFYFPYGVAVDAAGTTAIVVRAEGQLRGGSGGGSVRWLAGVSKEVGR